MKFFILFTICTAVNVLLSTVKSIITVKGGKAMAAIINAITYGFYTYIIILTNGDGLSSFTKMAITAVCNLVCVYIVKLVEEKYTPVKMWKIEMAIKNADADKIKAKIEAKDIPCNYNVLGNWIIFNCYCDTCAQTDFVNKLCKKLNGKISAYESKNL